MMREINTAVYLPCFGMLEKNYKVEQNKGPKINDETLYRRNGTYYKRCTLVYCCIIVTILPIHVVKPNHVNKWTPDLLSHDNTVCTSAYTIAARVVLALLYYKHNHEQKQ